MGALPPTADDGDDDMFYACDEEELECFYDVDGCDSPNGSLTISAENDNSAEALTEKQNGHCISDFSKGTKSLKDRAGLEASSSDGEGDGEPRGSPWGNGEYPLHRAVYYGDLAEVQHLLEAFPQKDWLELDPQGLSVLHLAVLRNHLDVLRALLDACVSPTIQSKRGWTALEEAVAHCSQGSVLALMKAELAHVKGELKSKKHLLLQSMRDLPDYSFKLKWELGSPVLGMLLRKVAPHDTYEVWKKGTRIRVDGTLKGVEENGNTMLPQWKRGHFSLLFDGATTPNTMLLLDHVRGSYVDLGAEKRANKMDLESEARMLMREGSVKTKLKSSEFRFLPVKGWLGGEATERIEGWRTRLYEATGKMKTVSIEKGAINIPINATWEEYLEMKFPEDVVTEALLDPLSLSGGGNPFSMKAPTQDESKQKGRLLTGRCWMAEDFPMSLRQLLPVLDIIGNANKHIARVGKFLQKYGELELFPVKLQVPLIFTIYALISFCKFKPLEAKDAAFQDSFFELPPHYRLKTIEECQRDRGFM